MEETSILVSQALLLFMLCGCREEKSNHRRAHLLLRKARFEMKCSLSLAFSQASHQETLHCAVIGLKGDACDADLVSCELETDGSFINQIKLSVGQQILHRRTSFKKRTCCLDVLYKSVSAMPQFFVF